MRNTLLLLALLLSACTTPIDHVAVAGWPKLAESTVTVSHREMRDICSQYTPWYEAAEGCTIINLRAKTCLKVLSSDFPSGYSKKHEDEHCEGEDHPGGTFMRDLLEKGSS